ncbi:hypothetical protein DM860_002965 [Cuscuta australis]|uniref:Lysine ketoglutarate reductase trans-splicing-like protein n=1 Tax=Cuscuta australis TaxID=267555 RepID=A0A328D103_9ASTE|nr:hypothetical protein DM860_002965 [Cuscuta australis]
MRTKRTCGLLLKMKQMQIMGFLCILMLLLVYMTTIYYHYHQEEVEPKFGPLHFAEDSRVAHMVLPRGIVEASSDLEPRALTAEHISKSKVSVEGSRNLLAMAVGIEQKGNVDEIIRMFISENFTIVLFHYDDNVDAWWDLGWSKDAIHIVAHSQTKWWFAKRFLHPDVVSIYDYIFLWDEDLGVQNFRPARYLEIVKVEGLEISQPALDPNSPGIHHRITVRNRRNRVHRRVYQDKGRTKCSEESEGPPCSGFVEGMAPVFSRRAWRCVWYLIQVIINLYRNEKIPFRLLQKDIVFEIFIQCVVWQNDLVLGWGMDMKFGYCAQGDRTNNVGVVDSEYLVHLSTQSLGSGSSPKKILRALSPSQKVPKGRVANPRVQLRRESTYELQVFMERWEEAVKEDKQWVDPYKQTLLV